MPSSPVAPYDALLLFSFGGPNGPEDVLPFLRNVTAGKNIPDERLAVVAEHYHHFGGASPINGQIHASSRRSRPSSPAAASTSRSYGATATGRRTPGTRSRPRTPTARSACSRS